MPSVRANGNQEIIQYKTKKKAKEGDACKAVCLWKPQARVLSHYLEKYI